MMKTCVWKQWMAAMLVVCLAATGLPPSAMGAEVRKSGQVFVGEDAGRSETKAGVKVTLEYQYSPTGGMAGVNAHAPETVEFFLNEDGRTTTPAAWPIPHYDAAGENGGHGHDHNNLEGFRVVLNAAPLNEFVKVPPTGDETPKELEDKLNRGDFDPDPVKMADAAAVTQAWIDARTFTTESGLVFQMVDKNGNAAQGSAALDGPQLILKNPEALTGRQEVTLEVNYRRDNGTYTVKHWIPKEGVIAPDVGVKDHWQVQDIQTLSGRIGAMTRAEAQYVRGYANRAISQQPIKADGSTMVDIFYTKDDTIRVIFDTSEANSGEIDRQQLNITDAQHNTVDFSAISPGEEDAPVKPGHIFAGWAFQDKEQDGALVPVTSLAGLYDPVTRKLTPNEGFLNRAQLQVSQETAGVNVLQFYPLWETGTTDVRVVFWTEDLTGTDDVDDGRGDREVKTHYFEEEGAAYSNVGFMTLEGVRTNTKLEIDLEGSLKYTDRNGNSAALQLKDELAKLPTMEIQTSYQGDGALKDASGFYTLDGGKITQMDGAPRDTRDADTAAPNGTTVVNVYYTRNIYKLEFIYSVEEEGHTKVAFDTGGFVIHDYDGNAKSGLRIVKDGQEGKIPAVQTITAKYGADLRDIWPCRNDIQVELGADQFFPSAFFISWCTTMGPYAEEARRCWAGGEGSELRKQYEPTIMGVYGAMSADIIADPAQHLGQENYQEETGTHKLYAFWWRASSYYRYNHCYEVPGVTQSMLEEQPGVVKMVLDGQSENDIRNIGYLIPADGDGKVMDIIRLCRFDDLRRASYDPNSETNQVVVDGEGDYYAFRIYQGKCYALSRQVNAASTNIISAQNPSARAHMRRLNTVADHSTKYQPGDGAAKDESTRIGTVDAPYDLFFYYDRIPYQIIYSVGSSTGLKDLGTKQIYYGAQLSDFYNIQLTSGFSESVNGEEKGSVNGDYAASPVNPNGWTLPATADAAGEGTQPVCPNRNKKGTTAWRFKGWAMDLAGTELLDDPGDWDGVVSGDLHLYAQWEAPKYTVEFDWDGGQLAFGSDAEYKVQEISANSTVVGGGLAPVPVKSGYYLDHWRATYYKLNEEDGWVEVKAPDYPFRFDQKLPLSLKIQAVWNPIEGAEERTYRVCHVLDGKPEVKVAADQTVSGSFVPGFDVWASPIRLGEYGGKDYSSYVPTTTYEGTQIPTDREAEILPITITYRPPAAADKRYTVRFVENGGSKEILKAELPAAEVTKTVYAGNWQEALEEKGYWLADANGDRADLKSDALVKTLSYDGERTAAFPVTAQVYDIAYQWPENMAEETKTALSNNLPTSYTPAKGATALPTPGSGSYKQGEQTYYFKSWKLVRGTLNGETNVELSSVTIAPASRGALTFEAQWSDKKPVKPTTPSGSGGSTSTPRPEDLLEREKHEAYIIGRAGGLAAPEANITRAEVVTIFYRLLTDQSRKTYDTQTNPFDDVTAEDWFFKPAVVMANAKIVEGYPDGSFAPAANITRGEFAAIAARFLSEAYTGESRFSDLDGHWAAEYVDRAAQKGWIKGYPDGTFRPDALITRAEAISLVNAVLGRAPHKEHLLKDMTTWPDNTDETKWYYLDIQEATNSHEYTWQTVNGERVEQWSKLTGNIS